MPPSGDLAGNPGMCPDRRIELATVLVCRMTPNPLSYTSQGTLDF